VGDETAFKTEDESVLVAPRYCVVGKNGDKIIISRQGKEQEVSPFNLFTREELEKAEREAQGRLDDMIEPLM
jgi:hypothetical protein